MRKCDVCNTNARYLMKVKSMRTYYVCFSCREKSNWQATLAEKEHTMRTSSLNYSKRGRSKRNANRYRELWEGNTKET